MSNARQAILSDRAVQGAPDLIVEITDPSSVVRDTGIKRRRYSDTGVSHYWLVDPRTRTLEEHKRGPNGYGAAVVYRSGDIFRPDLFSGLEIAIASLWA